MSKQNLNEQAQEILEIAQKHGVEQNFFFITTFQRYMRQLQNLKELEKILDKDGILVEKTYVKGTKNQYIHPALSSYNKTCSEANKIVSTLVNIIVKLRVGNENLEDDPLLKVLNGI